MVALLGNISRHKFPKQLPVGLVRGQVRPRDRLRDALCEHVVEVASAIVVWAEVLVELKPGCIGVWRK